MSLVENSIHILKVIVLKDFGVFLEADVEKDILLPNSEMLGQVQVGDSVIVKIKTDDQQRLYATEKFENELIAHSEKFSENQEVQIIILSKTDLGFKAIVNQKALGLLYHNEVFEKLKYGQQMKAYIKKVREGGKIDLILRAAGHKATEDIAIKIIEFLEDNNGYYPLTDKTPPEKIYELFGVSKKKYKIALGGLYKKRIIDVSDAGIRLLK